MVRILLQKPNIPMLTDSISNKGPFINYVVLLGVEEVAPKTICKTLLNRKDDKGEGVKNYQFWDDIVYVRLLSESWHVLCDELCSYFKSANSAFPNYALS